MSTDHQSPCELILKVGCNESDEISSAILSLLRSCSIIDPTFVCIERQIQPTTYFGSFTTQTLRSKLPIQSQSLSCVIFLTDDIFQLQGKMDFFKSINIWNFHHKIELVDEHRQIIARQDYYELSQALPLWSIAHIPYNRHVIIRFNIFTKNFEVMLRFYEHLFQRNPDSSKTGFVLFNLSSTSTTQKNLLYQLSIKYSPSIESYTISQGAYLKFRLGNLNHFIHQYTSKLFTINKSEYYIYDPDGNLLHLYLHNVSSHTKDCLSTKSIMHPNDSGFGDSSDPSIQLLQSNISQINPIMKDIDGQSHSSNDSGQCSSISSNEKQAIKRRTAYRDAIHKMNSISVRSATKSEIDCRLKQQQRTVFPRIAVKQQQRKPLLYDSEPRLSKIDFNHRYYSSMNSIKKYHPIRPLSTVHDESSLLRHTHNDEYDISYEVDSPRLESEPLPYQPSFGYLNAFLCKKQQQKTIHSQNVQQLISQFEKPNTMSRTTSRPKSAPLINPSSFGRPLKSTKSIIPPPIYSTMTSVLDKSLPCEWQEFNNDTLNTSDEQISDRTRSPRINIGITLDSRLTKTPVLDMLRSTTMQSDVIESQHFNRTHSFKHSFVPIARF